jgi:multidrug transporter EmrE-like cation transporter
MNRVLDHLLILASILALTYSQLVLKWQANNVGAPAADGLTDYFSRLLLNPWTLSALLVTALAMPVWLLLLGRLPLSYVYPFLSLSFVLVSLGGIWLLNEPLSALRVAGLSLIVLGVILVGRSQI